MKKIRRFQDGGVADEDFTADQLKFLGGADRTDPYILARMRSKFPDKPKEMKQKKVFDTAEGENKNITDDVRGRAMRSVMADDSPAGKTSYGEQNELPSLTKKVSKKTTAKITPKPTQSKKPVTDMNEMPESLRAPGYTSSSVIKKPVRPSRENTNVSDMTYPMKKGGMVSSASKRADGCAIRGKTRA
jgi:hypothetical protein